MNFNISPKQSAMKEQDETMQVKKNIINIMKDPSHFDKHNSQTTSPLSLVDDSRTAKGELTCYSDDQSLEYIILNQAQPSSAMCNTIMTNSQIDQQQLYQPSPIIRSRQFNKQPHNYVESQFKQNFISPKQQRYFPAEQNKNLYQVQYDQIHKPPKQGQTFFSKYVKRQSMQFNDSRNSIDSTVQNTKLPSLNEARRQSLIQRNSIMKGIHSNMAIVGKSSELNPIKMIMTMEHQSGNIRKSRQIKSPKKSIPILSSAPVSVGKMKFQSDGTMSPHINIGHQQLESRNLKSQCEKSGCRNLYNTGRKIKVASHIDQYKQLFQLNDLKDNEKQAQTKHENESNNNTSQQDYVMSAPSIYHESTVTPKVQTNIEKNVKFERFSLLQNEDNIHTKRLNHELKYQASIFQKQIKYKYEDEYELLEQNPKQKIKQICQSLNKKEILKLIDNSVMPNQLTASHKKQRSYKLDNFMSKSNQNRKNINNLQQFKLKGQNQTLIHCTQTKKYNRNSTLNKSCEWSTAKNFKVKHLNMIKSNIQW